MNKKKNKEVNLFSLILQDESSGLNIDGDNNISGILKGNESIKSNNDEPELLLYVKFSSQVNLTKILIESKSKEEENKPEILKLFANSSNMDFSDAASNSATEAIKLEGKFGSKLSLNMAKFRKLSELVLYFVKEDSIQFYGTLGEGMFNIGELKKQEKKNKK